MKAKPILWGVVCLCIVFSAAGARDIKSVVSDLDETLRIHPEYPVPSEPNQLFYIERSSNSNTVIYMAKLDAKGQLDSETPVIAYWRWYNHGGHIKQLNLPERMLAYGIKSVKHDGPNGAWSFKVAAFPERTLYLGLDAKGRPEAFYKTGERWGKIVYVYLQVDDSGIMPDVTAIDFFAIDTRTGKPFREHLTRP